MFLTIKVTIKLVALFLSMVVSLPILLYRVILSGCMSYFCSLQMVEARSSFFLAEDIYAQNSYTSMLLIKLGGCLDVTQLRELVAQRLINSPKYPELSSIVVYKFGYMFWKKVPNFNLDRHVLDLEDTSIQAPDWSDPNGVDMLAKNLLRSRTWTKDRPMWELVVANKYANSGVEDPEDSTSYLVVKYHHSLCDGYAAYDVFGNLIGKKDLAKTAMKTMECEEEGHTKKQMGLDVMGIIKKIANITIKAPVQIWKYFVAMEGGRKVIPVLDANSNDYRIISLEGPLQSLRNAKRKHGVDFNSVYITGITAFYRKLLQASGQVFNENVNLAVTLLMPGHSGKLSNNSILLNVALPLGESDPHKRLQIISQQMKTLTRSHVPFFIFLLIAWLGSLPHLSLRFVRSRRIFSTSPFVATNLGGLGQVDGVMIGDCQLIRWVLAMNYQFDGPGFKIGLISCGNKINISASVRSKFLPNAVTCKDRMENMLGECFKEWDNL